MTNKLRIALCFLFLVAHTHGLPQSQSKESLLTILQRLEKRFSVQFNYASTLVDGIVLFPPGADATLKESLSALENQQDTLVFVPISESLISIKQRTFGLCAYLKDNDTKEALPYVTVQYGSKATITNEEGFFELTNLKATDLIIIKHIGFKALRKRVTDFKTQECATITLVPYQEKLSEVVVYDFLVRGMDKLDNGTVVLDFERFDILPGLIEDDVLLSIQALPGIQSVDETVSNINIRGGSNDQNLITWDGIKMYQSGHFFGLVSMYNPQITQKVALRKNGSSAAETDGVSGTIAMKTSEYVNSKFKGSVGTNLIDANGFVDSPLGEKASLQLAVRKSVNDLVQTPTYVSFFKRMAQGTEIEGIDDSITISDIAFDFYDASFRLLYNPTKKDRFRVNFIYTANEVVFDESASAAPNSSEIRQSNLGQTSIAAGILHQRSWSKNLETEFSVYNTDYKLNGLNADILANQRFLQENKVSETGIKLLANAKIHPVVNWINGYNFVETKVTNLDDVDTPIFRRLEGEVLRTHSLFTEADFSSKSSGTELNMGLRFNYLEQFEKQLWEPRFSLNQQVGKHFNVEVLGEFKHQSTSQVINFQNDFLGLERRRWQLSNNSSIPVITSEQGSLGLNYSKNGWLVNSVFFTKKVAGITTQSQGFQGPFEFNRTVGSYYANGLEFLLRKQYGDNAIWLSYAYMNSNYIFEELSVPSFPNNFDITHGVTLGSNYTVGNLLLALGVNWRTGRPFTAPAVADQVVAGEINYGIPNENNFKDFLRVDFSANYAINWGKNNRVQLGFSLWNVLDRKNTINAFYRPDPTDDQLAQRTDQSSLGITPNASLRVFFN